MQGSMEASTSMNASNIGVETVGRKARGAKRLRVKKTIKESSLVSTEPSYTPPAVSVGKYFRGKAVNPAVRNKKLATHLSSLSGQQKRSAIAAFEHDNLLLPQNASNGKLQPESDLERTWKFGQSQIADAAGLSAGSKVFDLRMEEFGPYQIDYTSDGRYLAIAGRKGHVGTFEWRTGKLATELHLKETVRDISWLHNTSFFAVAQKKYVYIYDTNGLEVHQLRNHIEVNRMQFLKYHFLLATVGNAGVLKYQDTSTGSIIAEHRTKLGACSTMAQNYHTGVISLGHSNGTVTMWTPNMATPQVTLLAHNGPLTAISHDPSSIGLHFATTGLDGKMKVWDARMWATINEWQLRKPGSSLCYSQKGLLAANWGNHVTIYSDSTKPAYRSPGPYMTQLFPSIKLKALAFCPFEDVLGIGHEYGFSSLLVPGAGENNYDSLEADPYETKKSRREREVLNLLDKIQPDQIQHDTEFIGKLIEHKTSKSVLNGFERAARVPATLDQSRSAFSKLSRVDRLKVAGQDESVNSEEEDGSGLKSPKVGKVRGKSKVLKRVLRRKKNIVDAKTLRVKEIIQGRQKLAIEKRNRKIAAQQDEREALGRFR